MNHPRNPFTILPSSLLSSLSHKGGIWKFSRGWWGLSSTAQLSHPPTPDAPRRVLAQARAFLFYQSFYTLTQASGRIILYCAHRTSTVSPCAFCEQKGWPGRSLLTLLRPRVARAKRAAPPSPASPPSPTRTLFSALPDTPLQSSPNPSETDPYPSTPSSPGPRNGRCPVKFHRPGSAGH